MWYLAFLGFTMMGLITYILMKDKLNILVCFAILPVIFSFLSGANLAETSEHIRSGLSLTQSMFLMIMFSLPFFGILSEAGFFDILLQKMLKKIKVTGPLLCSFTVLLSMIATLDGSVMSTYAILIPLFVPLYKKLKIDAVILVFLTSVGVMFGTVKPWNARVLRSAAVLEWLEPDRFYIGQGGTENAAMYIFMRLFPLMILMMAMVMVYAFFLGKKNQKINGFTPADANNMTLDLGDDDMPELFRPNLFWFNLALIVAVVTVLMVPGIDLPVHFVFGVGLIVAVVVNYGKDRKLQDKMLSKVVKATYPIAPIVFFSGIVAGVLQGTGMIDAMVDVLVMAMPDALGSFIHIVIATLSAPLMFIFTNDTWSFGLAQIVGEIGLRFDVSAVAVVLALYFNLGAFASIVAQPQILMACGQARADVKHYIKFSFLRFWAISIVWIGLGFGLGMFI